jgi:transposase-like protein
MDVFSAPRFHDDDAARAFLERVLWPEGPVCPHCGVVNHAYATKRQGVYRCAEKACRKDFTVTMKTVMERSHIALHKWVQGFHMMCASKKGVSAHQLHRTLDLSYKAAWFLEHRIRECMRAGGLAPLGGKGKIVEADETYHGKVSVPRPRNRYLPPPTKRRKSGPAGKRAIVGLVERGGKVRTFHVAVADKETVHKIVTDNVSKESRLMTDESKLYGGAAGHFASHDTVRHSAGEYVRYESDRTVHSNTVENVFSIFKRGMRGVYQHCDEKHLHRYLAEFDFRFNHRAALHFDDRDRTLEAVKGAAGKRLTYRQPDSANVYVSSQAVHPLA